MLSGKRRKFLIEHSKEFVLDLDSDADSNEGQTDEPYDGAVPTFNRFV